MHIYILKYKIELTVCKISIISEIKIYDDSTAM